MGGAWDEGAPAESAEQDEPGGVWFEDGRSTAHPVSGISAGEMAIPGDRGAVVE